MRAAARRRSPLAALALLAGLSPAAHALPSFARQTGQECAACHVGAYGPQLTPYGVAFKIGGYTDGNGKEGHVPLSVMLVGAITHTGKDQAEPPTAHTHRNDNLTIDEVSTFLAGRLTEQLGAFIQATYDGVAQRSALDHADVRFAQTTRLAGKETVLGISVNNNPGV
ncbi:MAG: cytochrome c1 protein, partial [Ottowia sp.]|nr:cytochrome c1 protein [Ottowia sp.]